LLTSAPRIQAHLDNTRTAVALRGFRLSVSASSRRPIPTRTAGTLAAT
jgi:hypothetical protein